MKRRATVLTAALVAAFIFGVIVLAGGDWLPGVVIVVATVVGLTQQVRTLGGGSGRTSSSPVDRRRAS